MSVIKYIQKIGCYLTGNSSGVISSNINPVLDGYVKLGSVEQKRLYSKENGALDYLSGLRSGVSLNDYVRKPVGEVLSKKTEVGSDISDLVIA